MSPRRTPEEKPGALDGLKKVPTAAWIATGVLAVVVVAVVVVLLASGGSSSDEGSGGGEVSFTGSGYPNVDTSNTRKVKGSSIEAATVSNLTKAWTLPLEAESSFGSYAATPVIVNGVVYSQDLSSNVQAIELESGEVLWEKSYEDPDLGPNGVVVADNRVYGATATEAFALDRESGEEIWSTPLVRTSTEGVDIAPGYHSGLVYVSTVPTNASATYEGGGVGVLWALDGKTGKKVWHFDTVPKSLWGNPKVNAGGGLWYTPAFDEKGFMYFGVGNPAPFPGTPKFPSGSSRPGPNLYTNSLVKLNAKTGKMQWYYQVTPHDLYDWDFQGPAILVKAGGRDLVVASGKNGIAVAVDRETGNLVWKKPIGIHNGHDDDGLLAMRGEASKILAGTVYPGVLGGVIAPPSTDGSTVFFPVVNQSQQVVSGSEAGGGGAPGGELVALNVKTGATEWKFKFPGQTPFGGTTVVNDIVFATTFDGKLYAFDASNGNDIWETTLPAGINAGVMVDGEMLLAPAGVASAAGQQPQIVAYSLSGGE
jgi:outer membrane protein assembly factor BamB